MECEDLLDNTCLWRRASVSNLGVIGSFLETVDLALVFTFLGVGAAILWAASLLAKVPEQSARDHITVVLLVVSNQGIRGFTLDSHAGITVLLAEDWGGNK